jgi:hypothetical protein
LISKGIAAKPATGAASIIPGGCGDVGELLGEGEIAQSDKDTGTPLDAICWKSALLGRWHPVSNPGTLAL